MRQVTLNFKIRSLKGLHTQSVASNHAAASPSRSPARQSGLSTNATTFYRISVNRIGLSSVNIFMKEYLRPSHQGDWSEPTKFDQLRIKTETQLFQLINTELDLGIRDARQALKSVDTFAVVEECRRRANGAYAKVARLLPLVVEITDEEQSRMESSLNRLQKMLEALSAIGSKPTPAEDEIAVLARAVWEARGCPQGLLEEDWFRAERH
jgi:hypothetical protein